MEESADKSAEWSGEDMEESLLEYEAETAEGEGEAAGGDVRGIGGKWCGRQTGGCSVWQERHHDTTSVAADEAKREAAMGPGQR